jgi:hypothetical protein
MIHPPGEKPQRHPLGEFPLEAKRMTKRHKSRTNPHATPALDAVADKVLSYKPKPKSTPARKRARRAKKLAQVPDA